MQRIPKWIKIFRLFIYLVYLAGNAFLVYLDINGSMHIAHYQGQNYFDGYAVKFADNMLKIVQTITI